MGEMRSWILRMAKWDGLLPAFVWSAPFVVRTLLPNQRDPVELTAVLLPIVAFFIRFHVGRQFISTNNCRIALRQIQMVALSIGIVVLTLVDAVLILMHIMPQGAAFATKNDVVVWLVFYSTYVAAMAIAMYPGTGPFESLSPACRGRTNGSS